ncbi:MAG: ABC transporter substrate-binding protein [Planctomycetes bacterium]|nr:ABC transporter substrate-binding protein [Planctomycetota bacterium]MBI3763894.1 ABC transporter substrate-binding protein [Chloroflexota bacterium]
MSASENTNHPTSVFESTHVPESEAGGGPAASLAGEVLKGAFRVESKLGEGGMGTVYRGVQLSLGRAVAIKTLSATNKLSEDTVQRFFREAKILSQLNHPNIVSIIDFGTTALGGAEPAATPFIVMELLSGKPLDAFVTAQNRPPLRQVLHLMGQIIAGIAAAHQANIVHRDLKPSNVFVVSVPGSSEPVVKLLDFGLAKPATPTPESGLAVTQAGVGVGTCGFTAPEQLEGTGEPDARADVYGLGAILYFLLTARPPYTGKTLNSVLAKQMTQAPEPIDFPAQGLAGAEALEPVLHKAMSIAPEDRYQSVGEFKGALEAILTGILSNPRVRVGGSTGATTTAVAPKSATQFHRHPPTVTGVPAPPSKSRHITLAAFAALILIGGALALWLAFGGRQDDRHASGAGDGSGADKSTLTASAPGVTPGEITLGISAPFSGPAKELGRGMQTGIETYLRHVNESAGGIHGRKLKLLSLDDGYEPKRCAETMQDMLDKRPVFAFVGNVGTPTAEVAVPLILKHKRVFFGAFTGAGLLRRDPPDRYVFNYRASYAEETAAIVHYLLGVRKLKPDEIAVFAQQDGYGDAGFNGVAKALRKVGFDTDKILRVGYERNSSNVDAAVAELLKHKDRIKAVVMVPTYRPAAAFIKRVRDAGMNPIFSNVSFVGSDALAETLMEMSPMYAQGVIVTQVVPFHGSSATGVLQYREHLAQFSPEERPGFVSLEGYIAAKLLCTALDKAGPDLTTEALVEAIESIRGLDFGLGAPLTFGPSEHQGSHKVWATVLDAKGEFQSLDLD